MCDGDSVTNARQAEKLDVYWKKYAEGVRLQAEWWKKFADGVAVVPSGQVSLDEKATGTTIWTGREPIVIDKEN